MKAIETTELRRLLLLAIPVGFAISLLVTGLALWLLSARGMLVSEAPVDRPAQSTDEVSGEAAADDALVELPIALQNELDYLREEVEAGRERVRTLEVSLRELADRADAGEGSIASGRRQAGESVAQETGASAVDGPGSGAGANSPGSRASANREPARREYDRLVAVGIDTQTASLIQNRVDQTALARLDLIDRASREGWRDSEEFDQQLDDLREAGVDLREELGDDDYDRYLYEAGRNNRVDVGSVIGGSAADQAGLQAGDQLIAYADDRVFGLRELQGATRSGERGELVQVTVRRNGTELVVSVPRGPLGITLQPERVEP